MRYVRQNIRYSTFSAQSISAFEEKLENEAKNKTKEKAKNKVNANIWILCMHHKFFFVVFFATDNLICQTCKNEINFDERSWIGIILQCLCGDTPINYSLIEQNFLI